jgi:hypothetical protein
MLRLKNAHYISYENPKGKKGFLDITVHKNHITVGEKKGTTVGDWEQMGTTLLGEPKAKPIQ